jgi:O-antigen ligase
VAFLVAMPMLAGLWILRYIKTHPRSMVGPLAGAMSFMGMAAIGGLIFSWKRLYNIVFGGGDSAGSDMSRLEQFRQGLPHIESNPITGHGLGRGGELVGYVTSSGHLSIDSYVLSLLVETGVTGLVLYFGMILGGVFVAVKIYLSDRDERAEIAGPLACSMLAYGIYRLVLSQRENQTLFFILLALTFIVAQASARRLAAKMPPKKEVGNFA